MSGGGDPARTRIDKWLWAARFFKTRSLATAAVSGGKVHVNDERVKPARALAVGDRLTVRRGLVEQEIVVAALSERRGPASVAATLYAETEASVARREAAAEKRRLIAASLPAPPSRRPNKKDRRHIIRFQRRQESGERNDD